MAERMKAGIDFRPSYLGMIADHPLADDILGKMEGYAWAVNATINVRTLAMDKPWGELRWTDTGPIKELIDTARKHFKNDPDVYISVVGDEFADKD